MAQNHHDESASINTDQEAPSSLTMDDVSRLVNSAISSRMKSFEKKLEEFTSKLTPQQTEEKPAEKISNLELVQLKKQLELIQKERDTEVSKRKDFELRNTVKEQLLKNGVNPNMVKAAMAILVDSDKLVSYNEDNEICWSDKELGKIDLSSGLKNWSKTDEGKSFLAPKSLQGTGSTSRGYQNNIKSNDKLTKTEIGSLLEQALLNGDLE